MFLCPGRVRWMNNNKGIIARLLITSGWVTLRPGADQEGGGGQFVFRGSHGPRPLTGHMEHREHRLWPAHRL